MPETRDYQVTARKWRPTTFTSVVGQEHVTRTLKNAIAGDRLRHAYLFCGPRGVGKTTTARILAKALNCQHPGDGGEPCNECESCAAIASGRSMDVVEIDGASNNSVEDVRTLRDNAKYPPVNGRYKLYVIDEVHMLSTSAFNALLKTLEEPPKHLIFVFATTEPHKVLPTILSRCQRFDFRRMQIDDIVERLRFIADEEGMHPEDDALLVIARKADGSMRDAQSIFDQVVAFCGQDFTYEQINDALNLIDQEFFFRVTTMMRDGNLAEGFAVVDHIMQSGYDPGEFLVGLAEHFRNFLAVLTTGSARLIETTTAIRERFEQERSAFQQGDMIRALHLVLAAQNAIRSASQPRLRLELLLIQLAAMDSTVHLEELMDAIREMPDRPVGVAESTSSSTSGGSGSSPGESSAAEHRPPAPAPEGTASTRRAPSGPASAPPTGGGEPVGDTGASSPKKAGSPSPDPTSSVSARHTQAPAAAASAEVLPESERRRDSVSQLRDFPTGAPPRRSIGAGSGLPESGPEHAYGTDVSNAATAEAPPISIDEVQKRWTSFLESCSEQVKVVAALPPGDVVPGEMHGSVLRLYVKGGFQEGLLHEHRAAIQERVQTFFDAPLTIEPVIGTPPSPIPDDLLPSTSVNGNGGGTTAAEEHPFIREIVDRLGAVRL